jgi:hypothetical protein
MAWPSEAPAQVRAGFWGGLGGGWGSAQVSADELEGGDREGSGVGYFNLGWTLNEQLLAGAEFNLWSKTAAVDTGIEATANIYNLSGTLTFYPSRSSGFFVKGGAGVSFLDADFDVQGTNVTVDLGSGFGFIAGTGYDIRLGRIVSLTPAVNFWYGQPGTLKFAGETLFSDWKQNVIDFTIGLKFH